MREVKHLSIHRGFALPSLIHNNQALYRFPIFETSATALCGTTGIRLLKAVSSPAQIGKDPWFEPIHAGGLLLQYGAQTAELEWYALGEMKCATSTGPRLTIQ